MLMAFSVMSIGVGAETEAKTLKILSYNVALISMYLSSRPQSVSTSTKTIMISLQFRKTLLSTAFLLMK